MEIQELEEMLRAGTLFGGGLLYRSFHFKSAAGGVLREETVRARFERVRKAMANPGTDIEFEVVESGILFDGPDIDDACGLRVEAHYGRH